MTVSTYGFDGTLAQDVFSQLMRLMATSTQPQVVEGLAPSAAAGTRVVGWATGRLVAAGVLAVNDAAGTTTLDANATSHPRVDYLVLELVWGSTKTGEVKFVKGTAAANPVPPALQRDEGSLWQVPLARITVAAGATTLAAGDVEDCRPLRTTPAVYRMTPDVTSIGANAGPRTVATASISDPGWPYRLRISGVQNFDDVTSGHGEVSGVLDGSEVTTGRAGDRNESPAVVRPHTTPSRTGKSVVTFKILPVAVPSGQLTTIANHSGFTVDVIPA